MKKFKQKKPAQIQLLEAGTLPELSFKINEFLELNPLFKLGEIQHIGNDFFLNWIAVLREKKKEKDEDSMDFLECVVFDGKNSTKLSSKDTVLIDKFKKTLRFGGKT